MPLSEKRLTMPIAPSLRINGTARAVAVQDVELPEVARVVGLRPEDLFKTVEGIKFRYATDSARVSSSVVELRPPWKVKLPTLENDWPRVRKLLRERLQISQVKFATRIRNAGEVLLVPNECTNRLVQRWVMEEHRTITPAYQIALTYVLGCDVETICQEFPAAKPDEVAGQLITVAQLTEAFLVLADAYRKLRELNERMVGIAREPDAVCGHAGALRVSVPFVFLEPPRPRRCPRPA